MKIDKDTKIDKIIKENITITNSSTLHSYGIINGNICVEEGATLFIHGILNGDLIAKDNSSTYISGTMNGIIFPSEGKIELSGMLKTNSTVPETVFKIKGCYINGKEY